MGKTEAEMSFIGTSVPRGVQDHVCGFVPQVLISSHTLKRACWDRYQLIVQDKAFAFLYGLRELFPLSRR